jgi:hypothetical protein
LVGNVFFLKVGFEDGRALIVEGLEARAAAGMDEKVEEFGIGLLDDLGFAAWQGLNSNVVAVIVVEEEQVVVAFARGQRETAGEITIAATSGRAVEHSSKEEMGSLAVIKGWREKIRLRKKGQGGSGRLCGLDVLADLFDVGLGSRNGIRGVLAERGKSQSRESFQGILRRKSGDDGGRNWIVEASMGESHKLSDLGGMKGSVGSMRGRGQRSRHMVGNVDLPEAISGIAAVAS